MRPEEDPEARSCRLDNSRAEVGVAGPNDPTGSRPSGTLQAFIVVVTIDRLLITNPDHYKDKHGVPVTINDRDGVRANGVGKAGVPWCLVAVPVKRTKISVEIDNNRFPDVDTCAVVTGVAEKVAARM